jgi:Permuted papain-like amidase enzyme, YaeF/YiiX, C92 family
MNTKSGLILLLTCMALLHGCATQVALPAMSADTGPEAISSGPVLRFQTNAIAPATVLGPEELAPGDILLSADSTFVSTSIRAMTFAPVSHAAVYIGDGQLVDAMRPGVRLRQLNELLDEAALVLVLRYPDLTAGQAAAISEYAVHRTGTGFNFLGVTLHIPFSFARRVCELPLVPTGLRDACIRSVGVLNHLAASDSRLFCSQLVLVAYRNAGVTVTAADPRLISPADLLHMREGDVPSVSVAKQLRYVGQLKHERRGTRVASLR